MDNLVELLLGTKYPGAEIVARILLLAVFFEAVYTPFAIVYAALNKQKFNTRTLFLSVMVSYILTIAFSLSMFYFTSLAATFAVVIAQVIHAGILISLSRTFTDYDFSLGFKWGIFSLVFILALIPAELLRSLNLSPLIEIALWAPIILAISFGTKFVSIRDLREILQLTKPINS